MVPYGLNQSRHFYKLIFSIYNAHILVKNQTSYLGLFKNGFWSMFSKANSEANNTEKQEDSDVNLNPFLRITFSGMTVIFIFEYF